MGLVTAAVVGGAIAAAGTAYAANKSSQASKDIANAQLKAAQDNKVNINDLDAQVRDIAYRNAIESKQLEQQLTPEVASLRTNSMKALAGDLSNSPEQNAVRTGLMNQFNSDSSLPALTRSGLLDEAVAKARANLALGGGLDLDTQNQVTRKALATAGGVASGAGLQLGRDVTARDLGLTSLQLQQQRLQDASNLGQVDQGINSQQQALQAQIDQQNRTNRLGVASLLSDLGNQDFNRRFNIAQFTQGIAQPVVGLDPSAVANITVGNANNMNNAAQQAAGIRAQGASQTAQLIGQGAGTVGGLFSSYLSSGGYGTQRPYTGGTINSPAITSLAQPNTFNTSLSYNGSVATPNSSLYSLHY